MNILFLFYQSANEIGTLTKIDDNNIVKYILEKITKNDESFNFKLPVRGQIYFQKTINKYDEISLRCDN